MAHTFTAGNEAAFENGKALYRQKDYRNALAAFLSAASESSESGAGSEEDGTELAYYVGLCYARLNRYDDAVTYLEQVVTDNTDEERVHQCRLALAVLYSKTDRPRLADFELQKLVEEGYETAEVYCSLAYTAWALERRNDAIRHYETALSLKPESATALNGLGYVLACQGTELTKALSYCKKALDMNPDSPAFLDSLGWVYHQLGLNKEAMGFVKRAHSLLPDNAEIARHYEILVAEGTAVRENSRIQGHGGSL